LPLVMCSDDTIRDHEAHPDPAPARPPGARVLGMREVLRRKPSRVRKRHDPNASSRRTVRPRLGRVVARPEALNVPRRIDEFRDLAHSSWSRPETVAGFAQSQPNAVLIRFAEETLRRRGPGRLLDIGCGAGRNAIPLARRGWNVLGTDLSWPMLGAAAQRAREDRLDARLHFALAPMETIPARDRSIDFIVAHGIWNLARTAAQFRTAVAEAARVAAPGAPLFVFTFSRNTLPADAQPVAGEPFVFTQFAGEPQCFVTADELMSELTGAGFHPDPAVPLTEYNRPRPGALQARTGPVIYEAAFRREA
jgi:SAM-dependent methyltransferase